MVTIVQDGTPVLREKAQLVVLNEISTPKISQIIADMKEALAAQSDGIAIAAPQIGVSLRIFLVSGAILKEADKAYKGDPVDMIFINPVITKISKEKQVVEEGCLSVRWKYGKMKRAKKVSLEAYDENGKPVKRGASGLLAQIFQHETDHLNGILFTDEAYDIADIPPEEQENIRRTSR